VRLITAHRILIGAAIAFFLLYAFLQVRHYFSGDGVHPNEAGYAIMASLVTDAIAKSKLQPAKKLP